ncbi:hypothetical protein P154DRAFT_570233 [Amniculicola lignicola CBS 123094]|uniref:Uncharacterized protein n=1 Tax=Amniculicola lignicola CBS 123094 TaxID=1392246 RepID=A0A6A5WWR4_9PLEO|nr:hypothetical protein P154DRAFT_570233 [Amniculicola lignicola CBS 123094]
MSRRKQASEVWKEYMLIVGEENQRRAEMDEWLALFDNMGNYWSAPEVLAAFEQYWTDEAYIAETNPARSTEIFREDYSDGLKQSGLLGGPKVDLDGFLRGPIHPIVSRDKFITNLPQMDLVYRVMRPALRLVSEALENHSVLTWFVIVAKKHADSDRSFPSHEAYRPDLASLDPEQKAREDLKCLAKHMRITFVDKKQTLNGAIGQRLMTLTGLFKHLRVDSPHRKFPSEACEAQIILLSLSHYWSQLCFTKNTVTESERFRMQLILARDILHEIGHAWYSYHHGLRRERCIFEWEKFGELGFSLEHHIFSCYLEPCLDDKGLIGGVNRFCMKPLQAQRMQDKLPIQIPIAVYVSTKWVYKWFQSSTWVGENMRKETTEDRPITAWPAAFHIQRFIDSQLKGVVYPRHLGPFLDCCCNVMPCRCNIDISEIQKSFKSIWDWYIGVWLEDSKQAWKAGRSKVMLYYIPKYTHLMPDWTFPAWMEDQTSADSVEEEAEGVPQAANVHEKDANE